MRTVRRDGSRFRSSVVFVLVCLCLAFLLASCKKRDAAATASGSAAEELPVVTEATTDLLLTWVDERGEFHVEQKVADVPAASRESVRVVDPARSVSADRVFVADLRQARPDGTYAVQAVPREQFEALAVERRKAHGSVLAEAPPSASDPRGPSAEGGAAPPVIIYGAAWCGPCHQAAAYLKKKGVSFVEKDIEEDGSAAREMQAKLAKAGRHGGSIPVLDVGGKILVGFEPHQVDAALARRGVD